LAREFYPDNPEPLPDFLYEPVVGRGLLESALAQPRQSFAGRYLYRTIYDKSAALFYSVVNNHSLVDGNKRLALATVGVFLAFNRYLFYPSRDEAVEFALRVADKDRRPSRDEISRWFRRHSVSFSKYGAMSKAKQRSWQGVTRGALVIVDRMRRLMELHLSELKDKIDPRRDNAQSAD